MFGQAKTSWVLDLVDKMTAPLRRIQETISKTQLHFDKLEDSISKNQDLAGKLRGRLTGIAVGAASFAALSYGSVQFEQGMARANTMAGKSKVEFANLTSQVQDLASTIPLAREQFSEGLYATISAGVDESNWIPFLGNSAKAAYAANAELQTVVNATSTVVKAYGKSWDEAGALQDKFAKTVALGSIPSLEDLASSLPQVAGLSKQLGVNVDEMLGIFSTFAGVTGSTSEAATQLNAIFTALMKPSGQATDMADALGLKFDAKSIVRAGGVAEFFKELEGKVQAHSKKTGLTAEMIYGNLFGSVEALKTTLPMVSTQLDAYQSNVEKLGNSAGTVETMFGIMSATTASKLQLIRNKFGNMMDGIVAILAPTVIQVLDFTGKVLDMVRAFTEANPVLSGFMVKGLALGATIYGLVTVTALANAQKAIFIARMKLARKAIIESYIPAVKKAMAATWSFIRPLALAGWNALKTAGRFIFMGVSALATFTGSMVAAIAAQWGLNVAMYANPIGLVVLAIAALVGAVVLIIKKYDEWGAAMTFALGPLGMLINMAMSLRRHWDSVVEAFQSDGIIAGLKRIGAVLLDALLMPLRQVFELIGKIPGMGQVAEIHLDVIDKMRDNLGVAEPEGKTQADGGPETTDGGKPQGKSLFDRIMSNVLKVDNLPNAEYQPKGNGTGGGAGSGNALEGTGSGGNKSLVMNIEVNNNMDVERGADVDSIVDTIMEKLVDRLRDSMIQFG